MIGFNIPGRYKYSKFLFTTLYNFENYKAKIERLVKIGISVVLFLNIIFLSCC